MNASLVSLINALVLIAMGLWGYFASESPSPTAFIPVVFGVLILLCQPGLRKNNAVVAHIAVLLTFVILLGLVMPLRGALGREDTAAIARVLAMLASTVIALVAFVQSFLRVRRERATAIESDTTSS